MKKLIRKLKIILTRVGANFIQIIWLMRQKMKKIRGYIKVIKQLKSEGLFSLVRADHGTVAWPGDIDIAPETVWTHAVFTH